MTKKIKHPKFHGYIVSILVFLILISGKAMAGNYVKVATIGAKPPSSAGYEPKELVPLMINHWKWQFSQVLHDKPDLIVLPEACDRPSGLSREEQFDYFKVRKNQVLDFFASVAKDNHCYIAFGMKRELKDGSWHNSLIILDRSGKIAGTYDKNFPTIGEIKSGIDASMEAPIVQCDFGSVACAICFDLNFVELCNKYAKAKPDITLFASMYHGGLMQTYWAYACRSYFVGAIGGSPPSEILNPVGQVIASSTNYTNYAVATVNLDNKLVHLDYNRAVKLKALKAKYGPLVTITDPGRLGSVLITSEHNSISAMDMVEEFDIELLDDYFNRSRAIRFENITNE